MSKIEKGIFLDRDGVLNQLVRNPLTDAYESPHRPEDLVLCDDIENPLKRLRDAGYKLFIISNQPSFAKGKAALESIMKTADRFLNELMQKGVSIDRAFYCYHHPEGIIPEYSYACSCRKPEPFFLFQAQSECKINLNESWVIGDRDVDIECGRRAGCKTVLIKNPLSVQYQGSSNPDYCAQSLSEAADYILKF